ncbi:MAG: hypothetical protein Ct9H90mP16_15320 [Candidatus Poseidoniales archaeon]|nr:MAG: hypothetical protein Ct9H90mP16_15320 [Candidatus Poseidoniales archaeon]
MVTDFDTALSILENRTRRSILEHLVREAHYPLQLADLLGVSQQAIMKHLKVLEDAGFVVSEKVPSEKGGPQRESTRLLNRSHFDSISAQICLERSTGNCHKVDPHDSQVDCPKML